MVFNQYEPRSDFTNVRADYKVLCRSNFGISSRQTQDLSQIYREVLYASRHNWSQCDTGCLYRMSIGSRFNFLRVIFIGAIIACDVNTIYTDNICIIYNPVVVYYL